MKLYLSIFFSLFSLASFGNNQPLAIDTSHVEVRAINVATYAQDKAFEYDVENLPVESIWDRFWSWFWHLVNGLLGTKIGGRIFNIFMISLAVGITVFFIWKATGMNRSGMFNKNDEAGMGYNVGNDDIHVIDFNTAIDNAIAGNNYRLAIRLLYLQTLKLLTDKNFIDWKINKTNAAYVVELGNHPQQNEFARLTNFFDRTWYGEGKVEGEQFNQLKQSFNQFQQHLN